MASKETELGVSSSSWNKNDTKYTHGPRAEIANTKILSEPVYFLCYFIPDWEQLLPLDFFPVFLNNMIGKSSYFLL